MKAEIISVGTELLLGEIVDTNAAYISQHLAELGINVYHRQTVGDNLTRMVEALQGALDRVDLVLLSGGLGPTMDDITRDAIAQVLGEELVLDEQVAQEIEGYFARIGRPMTSNNKRQALRPASASFLPNSRGTAPGILAYYQGKMIVAMPGVPNELKTMFQEQVVPRLNGGGGKQRVIRSLTIHCTGIGESALEEQVADLIKDQTNPTVATYASLGEVRLRVTASAENEQEALALIEPLAARVRERLGDLIYGYDGATLEGVVGERLADQGLTLAVAESCSGGLISHRLTNIPGSSRYFLQGAVVYSNDAKRELLGVPAELLEQYGAVSPQVAKAMAQGVRARAGADFGLAVTGIAGPDGGKPEKPVGLVYIALAKEGDCIVEEWRFAGARTDVKSRTAQAALNLLRLQIP
ncbi:MAG: competence/damage-inducible protein A [Limnochordia bacterium]|jgi:nicotinamide-nucleotide amidase